MLYPQEATALNIVLGVDGFPMQITPKGIRKLAECVPMYNTGLMATTGEPIWEGDIIECDVVYDLGGMLTASRERGVMAWHLARGMWTVRLNREGGDPNATMQVQNTTIIGDIWQQPELLKTKSYEQK
jgi:hypothetical protein